MKERIKRLAAWIKKIVIDDFVQKNGGGEYDFPIIWVRILQIIVVVGGGFNYLRHVYNLVASKLF